MFVLSILIIIGIDMGLFQYAGHQWDLFTWKLMPFSS